MSTDSVGGTGGDRNFGLRIDGITDAFYPVYQYLFDGDSKFETDLERTLAEAQMGRNVEMYLTRALGVGAISGLVLFTLGLSLSYLLFGTGIVHVGSIIGLKLPEGTLATLARTARGAFLVVGGGLFLGLFGFGSVFGLFVALPYSRAAQRRREINLLLPDAISFMYALSVGGMNQLEILESMAKADDTYGEVSHEFQSIIKEAEYFDTDYRTAIQKRADETPSDELGQFLTDMLSIIDSGGNLTDFLADKKELHFQTAKEEQERILDTLELFTEIYITLSLFPLLLLVILVIMSLMGQANDLLLYGTVYGMIPLTGVAFIVLVSTVRQDEFGDGYLDSDESAGQFSSDATAGPLNLGLIRDYAGTHYIFDRIKNREETNETLKLIRQPHLFLKSNPLYSLAITVPGALAIVAVSVGYGVVPVSWQGVMDAPVRSTALYVYIPLFLTCLPLAVFWEWNVRSRREILNNLSATLRKLANANATGLTLLESVRLVGETSPGRLGDEFGTMYVKSKYGMHLNRSLILFNNKYHIPRLSRTVKLITKAHETSSEISAVLATAAQATESQDDIIRERKSRTRMQIAIILMTYLTLLGVMALLKTQFLTVMADLVEQSGGGGQATTQGFSPSIELNKLSLVFFHAVTLQAIFAGLISGYISEAKVVAGVKYVVAMLAIALGVWVAI